MGKAILVLDNSDRIQYAIRQFKKYDIEFVLKNEKTGHFHCRRKSDDKLFEFYAGTGKIKGEDMEKGIHALVRLISKRARWCVCGRWVTRTDEIT